MHRGEIYWVNIQSGAEHVNHGMRPALIVSNNACNECSPNITVVPLTTAAKKPMPTHVTCYINGTRNTILCESIVSINASGILPSKKFAELSKDMMDLVSIALMKQLGIMV